MIIITGASRGVGKYLLETFLLSNTDVIGTYNQTISSESKSYLQKLDVTDFVSISNFIENNKSVLKNIVLINCAGKNYNSFAHKADIEKWKSVIETNLFGTFYMIHSLLPFMREQNFGRIINFSSVAAQISTPGISAYASSKAALWGLTKSIAAENGSKGITINNINLGYSDIGMGINEITPEFANVLKQRIPSNSFCNPADIFNTVEYLIKTSYITGTSIDLNGGLI